MMDTGLTPTMAEQADANAGALLLTGVLVQSAVSSINSSVQALTASPDGVRTINTDSKKYTDWLSSSPLASILADHVVGPYRDQWGIAR